MEKMKTLTINGQKFQVTDGGAVRYDEPQNLQLQQQSQALDNIGADAQTVVMDEKYFDIDDTGLVSLKPEYRGHSTDTDYEYSRSNEGWGFEGSLLGDLPENLVIPDTVNGVSVTGFQPGIFRYNHRVKEITIPDGVTELPTYFCRNAANLRVVHNTEQITKIGGGVFSYTQVEKLSLPNLREFGGNNPLAMCSFLYSVDIGDNLTEIPAGMFAQCVSLAIVKGGANVTSIGEKAFYQTHNLKTLQFLSQVTFIGANAFYRSRIQFDWDSIKESWENSNYATPVQDNETDYWTDAEFTPCKNQLGTIMSQSNAEWKNKTFGDSTKIHNVGCSIFVTLMIHSALSGKRYTHPDQFADELRVIDAKWVTDDYLPTRPWNVKPLYEALGYTVTALVYNYNEQGAQVFETAMNQSLYEDMCAALARGAYIHAQVSTASKPNEGHDFVIYGINGNGEVLAVDPQNPAEGCREAAAIDKLQLCRMPYQNFTGPYCNVFIVEKKEE